MFTKIKQFFLGKPAPEAPAPYKVEAPWTHAEIAPATAPIVAEPVTAKPAAKKAAPAPKKPAAAKPAARKPAAKKSVQL
ncbi:hypothetical protein [Haliscomenobacter sp.]|uniref:hypothetical protein n=1 Tax=Haliscomenobacter sp. TaxID=2717303 RepID=UPI003364BE1D